MNDKYILDESGNPVPEPDMMKFARWYGANNRTVARETIGGSLVSTVFLGIDHRFSDDGPPILWETMVFRGNLDHEQDRCSGSREQAEAMHARMVERVKCANAELKDTNKNLTPATKANSGTVQ